MQKENSTKISVKRSDYLAIGSYSKLIAWGRTKADTRNAAIVAGVPHAIIIHASQVDMKKLNIEETAKLLGATVRRDVKLLEFGGMPIALVKKTPKEGIQPLLVKKFLKNNSLEDLEATHGVTHHICKTHNYKFSLNYHLLESKEGDPLASQCRGLILRTADEMPACTNKPMETVVLARPFDRFFNLGQHYAADIDFRNPDTVFLEKLDGTLCIVYFDGIKNEWCVATRSVPEADMPITGYKEYTFRELFEKALIKTLKREMLYEDISFARWAKECLNKWYTYCFELTSPINQVVVKYNDFAITFIAIIETHTGGEYDIRSTFDADGFNVDTLIPIVKHYSLGSLEDMLEFVANRNPQEHEGIVVRDKYFQRLKVKSAAYLALTRIKESTSNSPRALLTIIMNNKIDDAFSVLPDYLKPLAKDMKQKYAELLKSYRTNYKTCIEIANNAVDSNKNEKKHRKIFAVTAQKLSFCWIGPLMHQYQGRIEKIEDYLEKQKNENGKWSNSFLDGIIKLMGYKDKDFVDLFSA